MRIYSLLNQIGKHVGTEVAQSGLGNDNQEKTFHSYYQWVPFVLFFQVSFISLSSCNEFYFRFPPFNSNLLQLFVMICRVASFTCHITFGRTLKMAKLVWSHKVFVVCLHCHRKNAPADKNDWLIIFWKVCARTTDTHSVISLVKFWIWSMLLPTSSLLT